MLALVILAIALTVNCAIIARMVRGGGYGRPSVPSIAAVGAERTKVLSSAARADVS